MNMTRVAGVLEGKGGQKWGVKGRRLGRGRGDVSSRLSPFLFSSHFSPPRLLPPDTQAIDYEFYLQ